MLSRFLPPVWEPVLLSFLVVIISTFGFLAFTRFVARSQLIHLHGCQPPLRYAHKDPIFGLDSLHASIQARKNANYHHREQRLHYIYGKTYLSLFLGSWVVNTIEPENLETMLSTNFSHYEVGFRRRNAFEPLFGNSIFQSDGKRWKELRTQLQQCFTRVETSQPALLEHHSRNLLAALPPDGQAFDMAVLLHRYAADVSTHFLFGESIDSIRNPKNLETGALKAFNDTHAGCEFRWLLGRLTVFWPQSTFMKNVRITHQFIQHYVDAALQRRGVPSSKASSAPGIPRVLFLDQLAQRTQNRKVLQDELTTLYFAGTDAPAALLSNLFFILSKKPAVWDRLRTEVRPLAGKPPSIDQLKKLRYVGDCIRESKSIACHHSISGSFS
jgi:cytochrome P450